MLQYPALAEHCTNKARGRGKSNGKGEKGSVFSGGLQKAQFYLCGGENIIVFKAHVSLTR